MTHKERMLMAARGEMPGVLPYAPRFDLWYNANSYTGTLPKQHQGRRPMKSRVPRAGRCIRSSRSCSR